MTTMELDTYVTDTLMQDLVGHDRQPSAFLVYLHLWRQTSGGDHSSGPRSLRTLAEATGLSKRAVQMAVASLEKRRLIEVERALPTAVPEYTVHRPWARRAN
jgi:DNA-binding MarR family transcriptional regulator